MTKVASCQLPNLEKRFSMNYMRESLIESISSVFACVFVLHVCIWPAVLTCRVLPNQHSTPLTNTLFFSLLPMSRYTELVKHEAEQLTAAVFLTNWLLTSRSTCTCRNTTAVTLLQTITDTDSFSHQPASFPSF